MIEECIILGAWEIVSEFAELLPDTGSRCFKFDRFAFVDFNIAKHLTVELVS